MTRDEALVVVRRDWRALRDVPPEFRSAEVCAAAVREHGAALVWVPPEMRGDAVMSALAGMKHSKAVAIAEEETQVRRAEELTRRGHEALLEALQAGDIALEYVPYEHRTLDICVVACRDDDEALAHVPDRLRSEVEAALTASNPRP